MNLTDREIMYDNVNDEEISAVLDEITLFYSILYKRGFRGEVVKVPRTRVANDTEYVCFINFEVNKEDVQVTISTSEKFGLPQLLEFVQRARNLLGWMINQNETYPPKTLH